MSFIVNMWTIVLLFIIASPSFINPLLITEKRLSVSVERGKSAYLSHAHLPIDPKLQVADLCQVEVDDIQPLSSAVGFVKPKKFPCFFNPNSVIYQHEGSTLTSTDTIFLNIYFFRKHYSVVQNVSVFVTIKEPTKPLRINLNSHLTVKSWKGISEAISSRLLTIHYDPHREFCRFKHLNHAATWGRLYPWLASRFWPITGVLITFNKTKIYEINMECQQALLMGFRFMHRKSRSSLLDFVPVIIEITKLYSNELVDLTYLHIPIHISSKPFFGIAENLPSPPVINIFRTITLTNSGGTLSLLPSDCLELSNQDKDRSPLIVHILSIQSGHHAYFRNMRDATKTIWSFTFTDLVKGLIAFQLDSYSKDYEKIFRVDLQIMDSYFVRSNVLVLRLIDRLENKDQLFQVFTKPFYTYTSFNRPLKNNNIQILGDIDLDLVKYTIVGKNISSGSFYKSPSTSLINKVQTTNPYFSTNDIKNSSIFYKHSGDLGESDLVNIEVSIDRYQVVQFQLPIFICRVYNRSRQSLLENYVEFSIPKSGIYRIGINGILNKNYYFQAIRRDHLDIFFDIVDRPQLGTLLKLLPGQNITTESRVTTTVRFNDLLNGVIFYRNNANYKANQDALELKQQGRMGDLTIKIIFNIQNQEKRFLIPEMNPKIMFTVVETDQYKKISYLNLNYVNYFLRPEEIFYEIVCFPHYENANVTIDAGRLVSLKSIQNDILVGDTVLTTKITNYRSAHITSVVTFTQKQILENDIVYIPPLDDIGPEDRRVRLLYSVRDIDDYEIRNIPFTILIKAVNNRPPLLKKSDIVVPRDEEVLMTFANFDIQDEDTKRTDLIVEIVTLPTYGTLFDGLVQINKNGYKFRSYKLEKQLIKYKHNGRNVNKDNFNVRLFDGIQSSSVYNIPVNITKRVLPTSNWSLYVNNSVIVKENSTVVLHQSIFQNVLQAFDLAQFPNPMFIIVAMPTRGNILNGKAAVSTFTLEEVKKGLISYQHLAMEIGSKSQFDFSQVWVLENGESFNMNFTILPVNSQPPKFYSQMPLQVNEGGSVIISYYSISFVDLDSTENDIIVQVVTAPIWGIICEKGGNSSIKTFSINDIKLGKIIYNNSFSGNGSEQTHDVFTIRGTDGNFLSSPVEIQIFIHSVNDEWPNLFLSDFNIAVGEKKTLNERLFQVSDADVPRDNIQITVTKFPVFGNLSLEYKYGEIRTITRTSPPLTLQLLKLVSIIYIQSNSTVEPHYNSFPLKDLFEFTVSDGKHVVKKSSVVNITGYNRVPPLTLLSLIQLNKIAEKVISPTELSAIDPDTLPEDIIFTILKTPEKGSLTIGERRLLRLETFSQKDIEQKNVRYKYTGPSVTYAKDDFLIRLYDGSFESSPKQVYIFMTQPIQIPKMSVNIDPITVNIGRKFTLEKSFFVITNPVADVVKSLVFSIKSRLTCGGFYYYSNLDFSVMKFTFEDIQERKILLFVSDCPEAVKLLQVPVTLFSHKGFQQDTYFNIGIIPRISAVPTLKRNATIDALIGSNVLITKDILSTIDEDTPSDKIVYRHLTTNQSVMTLLVNKEISQTFTQFDINSEKVEIQFMDDINMTESNVTLLVSDGENEGFMFNSNYQMSGMIVLPIVFTNWKHSELILLKYSVPVVMKFIDGFSAFQWTYEELLVSRPDAQITIAKELKAGFFYNQQTKKSISSFNQVDVNRGRIYYLLHKDKNLYKEILQFKIFYQGSRLSSEILEMQWSIIEFERVKYRLCPQRGLLTINVTRLGNLRSESQALVGFESMEAIMNQDFRLMSQRLLIFAPGEVKKFISIKILMTGSVLKDNTFKVTLKSPKQAIFGQKSTTTVIIKNRKTCGSKEYFLAEKTRQYPQLTNSPMVGHKMMQDLDPSSAVWTGDHSNQDLPSSDELEKQYEQFLSKQKLKVSCLKGWILNSRRCYMPVKEKMPWNKANDYCLQINSYLTTVPSDSVLRWLSKLFPNPRSFWIGLHMPEPDLKKWKYPNNEAVLYTNWDSGFPKAEGRRKRNCVMVTKKLLWKNRPCQKKRINFVCMKNPEVA